MHIKRERERERESQQRQNGMTDIYHCLSKSYRSSMLLSRSLSLSVFSNLDDFTSFSIFVCESLPLSLPFCLPVTLPVCLSALPVYLVFTHPYPFSLPLRLFISFYHSLAPRLLTYFCPLSISLSVTLYLSFFDSHSLSLYRFLSHSLFHKISLL